MAIIHTTPKRSGTEALLKILDNITDEIVLVHGKILMGQFSQNDCNALKLSLYVNERTFEYIGVRNVFIEDVRDTIELRFGNKMQTQASLELLWQTNDWAQSFAVNCRATYSIGDLHTAAKMVRDFLLFGRLPGTEVSDEMENLINQTVPSKGFIEFNVMASLLDCNSF